MRKQFLIAVGFVISTAASAQDWKPSIEKWRSCADAAAARYSKSSETAQQVARLAALACNAEKIQATQAVTQVEGVGFAAEYIEAAERHYVDRLSVNVIEMRLQEQKSADTTCNHDCALTRPAIDLELTKLEAAVCCHQLQRSHVRLMRHQ